MGCRIRSCAQEPATERERVYTFLTQLATSPVTPSPLLGQLSDLVGQMLRMQPASRITARAALRHPVFAERI